MSKKLIGYAFLCVMTLAAIPFVKNKEPLDSKSFHVITDTPQKQYTFVIKISPADWKSLTDTATMISGEIGRSMTVDESRAYQKAMVRQFQFLAARISVDSIITKPKR